MPEFAQLLEPVEHRFRIEAELRDDVVAVAKIRQGLVLVAQRLPKNAFRKIRMSFRIPRDAHVAHAVLAEEAALDDGEGVEVGAGRLPDIAGDHERAVDLRLAGEVDQKGLQLLGRSEPPCRDMRPGMKAVAPRLLRRRDTRGRGLAGQERDRHRCALRDEVLGVAQGVAVLRRHLDRIGRDQRCQPLRRGLGGRADLLGLDAAVCGRHRSNSKSWLLPGPYAREHAARSATRLKLWCDAMGVGRSRSYGAHGRDAGRRFRRRAIRRRPHIACAPPRRRAPGSPWR